MARIIRKTIKPKKKKKKPKGRYSHNAGYVRVNVDGVIMLEHRYVMELALGRKLKKGETVHHKDEDKHNNVIDNLEVIDNAEHVRQHRAEDFAKNNVQLRCAICDKPFFMRNDRYKHRIASGQVNMFCSRICVIEAATALDNL